MNSYLDGEDQLSSKFQTQQKCRPKRRSVFYQQAPIQHDNNEHTTSNFNNNSSQLSNSSQNKHHKEEKLPYKDYKCVSELQVFKDDPYLNDHVDHFQYRNKQYNLTLDRIEEAEGSLFDFADSYKKRGFYEDDEENIIYEEWAPGAKEMYLTGEFCSWDRKQHRMERGEYGVWKIKLPKGTIPHDTKVKVHLLDAKNNWVDKIPIYINYAVQYENKHFDGVYWNPPEKYKFIHPQPKRARAPKIYECHIGMSGIEPKVHSFTYFKDNVLPRISKLGYNCIQIMAIAEHPYYGSFGYHVSLPFAISSRFGTPEQFKELVDQAHFYGIQVLIDIVHSHVASNVEDGINQWDGTDHMYFHSGEKGHNKLWDSKLYNYNNFETLRLLVSNLQYFLVEYNVDGFRFDGVTSMLYHHHGIGVGFTGGYHEYFGMQFDVESAVYLMLANKLIHTTNPEAITIAEDVSGYPTLCRSHRDGGMGFDFRLQMAVPDKWIKLLKEVQDEDWDIEDIVHTLTNRRYKEPCITYAESHDQALVGDKTISMWLFDKEIYHNMSIHQHETLVVSRGMALHKMLRLITLAMGGEGYLNFMGNEFGHPEWIDFPREGNGWSYHHCRRRWDICDDKNLRYNQLYQFDISMQNVENVFQYLDKQSNFVNEKHGSNKVIVYEKSNLLFVFNFHPNQSFENYKVGTHLEGDHIIVLDTDSKKFGGYGRLDAGHTQPFPYHKDGHNGRPFSINLYIPARTAQVLCLVKDKQNMNYKDETLKIDE